MHTVIKMSLIIILFSSCNAQKKFDLFKIDFTETIEDIVKQNNAKLENGKSEALTLFGFDRFQSSNEAFLVFNDELVNGTINGKNNNVILHYNDGDKIISMYEINLYTTPEAEKVKNMLTKEIGEPSHHSKNEDDSEITVWKNETTKIYYFLMSYNEEDKSRTTELTAIDMKKNRANEWIDFRDFKYFLD